MVSYDDSGGGCCCAATTHATEPGREREPNTKTDRWKRLFSYIIRLWVYKTTCVWGGEEVIAAVAVGTIRAASPLPILTILVFLDNLRAPVTVYIIINIGYPPQLSTEARFYLNGKNINLTDSVKDTFLLTAAAAAYRQ